MAWFDILGGLAGGLNQGLGQVQQNVEARRRSTQAEREMLLKQLEAVRQQEEIARAQALTPINALEEGVEFDPTDPTYAAGVKIAGPGAFVKGASGKGLMKKPKASTIKAEKELAEFDSNAPIRAGERQSALKKQQMQQSAFNLFERKYGPDWVEKIPNMDLKERTLAGVMLMGSNDAFLQEAEKSGPIAAAISADGYVRSAQARTGNEGLNADRENDNERALLSLYYTTLKDYKTGMAQELRNQFGGDQVAHYKAWRQRMGQSPVPAMGSASVAGERVYDSNGRPIS